MGLAELWNRIPWYTRLSKDYRNNGKKQNLLDATKIANTASSVTPEMHHRSFDISVDKFFPYNCSMY